ncbi:MAG: DoxX family protein [Chitinophagaceae bacterium]|nr:DoxX family protein [Chitinophagaceae bacterium]
MNKKFAIRLFFLYFFLQAVPLDWKFYRELFSIDWAHLHYGALFSLAHYTPRWFGDTQQYADWVVIFFVAFLGAIAWGSIDRGRSRPDVFYERIFYWGRVIARYRLAIAMLAYGFLKLYPLQAPYPSLSNLNTNYGDFTRWKLFSLSLGIVPGYESFLGLVEIAGALLLLYRRSASIGAFVIAVFLGNVYMSNVAYGGGDKVYSLYLISLALYVLSYDLGRLTNLLIFQRQAAPNTFKPVFAGKARRYGRIVLKTLFVFVFVLLYGFKTGHEGGYQFPVTHGLPGAAGVYNVAFFRINKDTLAYSKTDSLRWQDVVFEKWATLSIRSGRVVVLDSNNVERPLSNDVERTYELEGSAGRHYYNYVVDTVNHLLVLRNKNPHYKGETMILSYNRSSDRRIILSGFDQDKDSIYVVLDRVDKKYLLEEAARKGRQGTLKL